MKKKISKGPGKGRVQKQPPPKDVQKETEAVTNTANNSQSTVSSPNSRKRSINSSSSSFSSQDFLIEDQQALRNKKGKRTSGTSDEEGDYQAPSGEDSHQNPSIQGRNLLPEEQVHEARDRVVLSAAEADPGYKNNQKRNTRLLKILRSKKLFYDVPYSQVPDSVKEAIFVSLWKLLKNKPSVKTHTDNTKWFVQFLQDFCGSTRSTARILNGIVKFFEKFLQNWWAKIRDDKEKDTYKPIVEEADNVDVIPAEFRSTESFKDRHSKLARKLFKKYFQKYVSESEDGLEEDTMSVDNDSDEGDLEDDMPWDWKSNNNVGSGSSSLNNIVGERISSTSSSNRMNVAISSTSRIQDNASIMGENLLLEIEVTIIKDDNNFLWLKII